jgi:membrane-bound serine protease (ClpP class)
MPATMFSRARTPPFLLAAVLALNGAEPDTAASAPATAVPADSGTAVAVKTMTKEARVYVIPVHGQIGKPILYIVRRGLKEAIEQKADAVVLDMDTPGGEMGVTLEIMEALQKFPGQTMAYVDKEAMSAGAFISAATEEIYFAPGSVIGAAAPVTSAGGDIDATMKEKLVSYMKGKVRAVSEGKGFRGEVVSAMIDSDYELKIGDTVIKAKGGLLTLTATEAMKAYGDPPHALLGAGIAKDVDTLLAQKFGAGHFTVRQFKVTWSEDLAQYLTAIAPLLLGVGMLALFIEFKMPGHGWIGGIGVLLLALVFFGHHIAGLSGHEPVLFFAVGLLMLAVEIFFFPGVFVLAAAGIILMLGSLLWAMADIWPNEPFSVSGVAFVQPLGSLGLGLAIAVGAGAALLRYLPKGWVWDKLVVTSTVAAAAQSAGLAPTVAGGLDALIGHRGIAATALRPGGQVEVEGRRFEAKVEVGAIDMGAPVVVRGRTDFGLIVEKADV